MRAGIQIKNHVQDVGLRSIVTAVVIENGIKRAKVLNDERDDTVVNVILDEEEKTLDRIVDALNRELRNKEEYPQLPGKLTVNGWEKADNNPEVLPALSPYSSDALQLRQMSKFVGVVKEMIHAINTGFDKLPDRLDKAIKGD